MRARAVCRCASSGRWMRPPASRSAPKTSPACSDRRPRAVLNRPWAEIAAALKLDPQGQVAAALAARDTWSGIVVNWPVDGATSGCRSRCRACRYSTASASSPASAASASAATSTAWRALERSSAPNCRSRPKRPPKCCLPRAAVPPSPAGEKAPALSPGEHSALSGARARARRAAEEAARHSGRADFGRFRRRAFRAGDAGGACRRRPSRRARRAMAMPPATPAKAGRSSTSCRSASWSIGSTIWSMPTAPSSIGPATTRCKRWRRPAVSTACSSKPRARRRRRTPTAPRR